MAAISRTLLVGAYPADRVRGAELFAQTTGQWGTGFVSLVRHRPVGDQTVTMGVNRIATTSTGALTVLFRVSGPYCLSAAQIFFLAVVTLFGCSPSSEEGSPAPTGSSVETSEGGSGNLSARAPYNVLFVALDAASANRMSLYGYGASNTPFLDSLAKESIVFESAYSQGTLTLTSVWSFLTGKYPYVPDGDQRWNPLRPEDESLPEMFQRVGFATGGFSENPFISEEFGFTSGFDHFTFLYHREPRRASPEELDALTPKERFLRDYERYWRTEDVSQNLVDGAKRWIEAREEAPWFCYVHLLRPHNPYYVADPELISQFIDVDPPEGKELHEYLKSTEFIALTQAYADKYSATETELEVLEQLYDANMAHGDRLVRQLVEFLETTERLGDTLVVVLSDHGESFGEHGHLLHGTEPYEELIHVPLLIRPPDGVDWPKRRIASPIQLVNLVPTFTELYGLQPDAELDGRSLLEALEGAPLSPDEHLISEIFQLNVLGFREGDVKLLLKLSEERDAVLDTELYNLAADPGEKHDLSGESPHMERLLSNAKAYLQAQSRSDSGRAHEVDPQTREALESLGYVQDD